MLVRGREEGARGLEDGEGQLLLDLWLRGEPLRRGPRLDDLLCVLVARIHLRLDVVERVEHQDRRFERRASRLRDLSVLERVCCKPAGREAGPGRGGKCVARRGRQGASGGCGGGAPSALSHAGVHVGVAGWQRTRVTDQRRDVVSPLHGAEQLDRLLLANEGVRLRPFGEGRQVVRLDVRRLRPDSTSPQPLCLSACPDCAPGGYGRRRAAANGGRRAAGGGRRAPRRRRAAPGARGARGASGLATSSSLR